MRSGQLARLTGISTDTLRHYERLGILPRPERTAGNYREYPSTSHQRVKLIQDALAIGFSLCELATVLAVRDKGGTPCRQVRDLLNSKIVHINQHIQKLTLFRSELKRVAKDWDARLRKTKRGQPTRLLENVLRKSDIRRIPAFAAFPTTKGR